MSKHPSASPPTNTHVPLRLSTHREMMSPFLQQELQSVGDVLPRSLQPQHGVVERKTLKHGDGVGDTTADFEGQSARPPGGKQRQHGRVANAECRHLVI